ncbi:hypothetical protein GGR55DRAFT_646746 [Xylaria sp. FL0064]|nr:hypothetical protein GGR55DRAFT_646746 [Xylaria sp. FL0064]
MFKPPVKMQRTRLLTGWSRGLRNDRMVKKLCVALVLLTIGTVLWSRTSGSLHFSTKPPNDVYLQRGVFRSLPVSGFVNMGSSDKAQCDNLRYEGELNFQQSIQLSDDFVELAQILGHHPMVDYEEQDKSLTFEQKVKQTWAEASGSSIWLQKYNVFLVVTRAIFYSKGVKQWPRISFLRGRVYDKDWVEKKNYTINWQGIDVTFPTVFKVPTPYEIGGCFYGPEDPRITIEEGVDDAEPVVVYNLLSDTKEKTRTMHVFRPFSNFSIMLTINDKERKHSEKNWAPFFYNPTPSKHRLPSQHIHFLYNFRPLVILKCHLERGLCDFVYDQKISKEQDARWSGVKGWMTGGTNLVPVPLDSGVGTSAYLGFPRSHMNAGCGAGSSYRPELMVLVASNRTHFHIDHLSEWIDFGSAVLTPQAQIDPCGEGRILMASSIARWDRDHGQDVMTLFLSLADAAVRVLRVHGVLTYINGAFRLKNSQKDETKKGDRELWKEQRSDIGFNVLGCAVQSVQNHTIALVEAVHGKALG